MVGRVKEYDGKDVQGTKEENGWAGGEYEKNIGYDGGNKKGVKRKKQEMAGREEGIGKKLVGKIEKLEKRIEDLERGNGGTVREEGVNWRKG